MGHEYYFHVEHHNGQEWACLPESRRQLPDGKSYSRYLFDTDTGAQIDIFFGHDAFLKMIQGPPPGGMCPELRERKPDHAVWWRGFDGLGVKDWNSTWILREFDLEPIYAGCFKDGKQKIPYKKLRRAGMPEDQIFALENYSYSADKPMDWESALAYKLYNWPPESSLTITFEATVASILGPKILQIVNPIRKKYGDENLRFIAYR